jgi:hypothetical protein
MSSSEGNSTPCKGPAAGAPATSDAHYTLHPFGDEWLWDSDDDSKPLTVSWERAAEIAQNHRGDCLRTADESDDDGLRQMAARTWFIVRQYWPEDPEREPFDLSALIGPDGTLYDYDDPRCLFLYEGIGSDGEWPTPYPDDVIVLCAKCGEPMVCQNASHIRKIGVHNPDTAEVEEREPTEREREERQPRQGQATHFECGPVRHAGSPRDRRGDRGGAR